MLASVQNSKYCLEILYNQDPESPRKINDNFGQMVCWHTKYNLGDEHDFKDKDVFLFELLEKAVGDTEKAEQRLLRIIKSVDSNDYKQDRLYNKAVDDKILDYLSKSNIILPLYLYDHSGITMNTTGFSCLWDSGQVGWIYVPHEKIKQEYGEISPETIQKAEDFLIAEVKEYDYYIRGECFGFKLYENEQEIDSCWGFIGEFNDVKNNIKEYLPKELRFLLEEVQYDEQIQEDELEMG